MSFHKKTIKQTPLAGKTVLVRVDFNVPLKKDGTIDNDFRMTQSLPTINYLLDQSCKVVLCAHLGRPDKKHHDEYSLEKIADHLESLLQKKVQFVSEAIGDVAYQAVKNAPSGSVILLENLRFYEGEEYNDAEFAKQLAHASCASYFVQDGFGVVHRAHASTDAITHLIPSVAGLLLETEYRRVTEALENPKRPLIAVLGGAKVSDKMSVIERFVALADQIIIGGAMANTFLKYNGMPIGKSVHEEGTDELIKKIYETIESKVGEQGVDDFLILPSDVAVAPSIDENQRRSVVQVAHVAEKDYILDMGSVTIERIAEVLNGAGTVIWSGTLGYAELEQFAHASARTAMTLAQQPETVSIIGGGDTSDFVLKWDALNGKSFTHVSTGGGASLQLMSGETLPGVEALLDA